MLDFPTMTTEYLVGDTPTREQTTEPLRHSLAYGGMYALASFIVLWGINYQIKNGFSPLAASLMIGAVVGLLVWEFQDSNIMRIQTATRKMIEPQEAESTDDEKILALAPRLVPLGWDEWEVGGVCKNLSLAGFEFREKNTGLHPEKCIKLRGHWLANNVLCPDPKDDRRSVFTFTGKRDVEQAAENFTNGVTQ